MLCRSSQSQAPSLAADVGQAPVVPTAKPECNEVAELRDQVTVLTGTVNSLSADIAN